MSVMGWCGTILQALPTPFRHPCCMKKFMIACVIAGKIVSPQPSQKATPEFKWPPRVYLQSVTFLTHCCAVVQRTPIAPDSNDTTGSALLHPFTCSTAHAIAPDGSTANSQQPLRFRTWGCARTFSAHAEKAESVETHLSRSAPMLQQQLSELQHPLYRTNSLSTAWCSITCTLQPCIQGPIPTPSTRCAQQIKSEKCRTGVADGRTPFDETVSYLQRPKPTMATLAAARTAAGV
jgi:hypothetical protein